MTLFSPKSLDPARWLKHLVIIIGLYQVGPSNGQGRNFEQTESASNRFGSRSMFSLTQPIVCHSSGIHDNRPIDVFTLENNARGYSYRAEIFRSGFFWISEQNTTYPFALKTFVPKFIKDRWTERGLFFFPSGYERTFEKIDKEEPLALKSKQLLPDSWPFKVIVLAILGFLSYSLCRVKINRLTTLAKASEKIVRDLNNDIGSNASAIGVLADVVEVSLATPGDTENARHLLRKIRALSEKVMGTAEEIMWSITTSNDSPEEVSKRLRLMGSRLEEDGVNFTFNMGNDSSSHKFNIETRNHIYVIFKEILTNIEKHAYCKNAKAKLSFSKSVELTVIDDGIGFDTENGYCGNGFHIIRSRCEKLSGKLSIISRIGKGTTIRVIFPN